MGNEAGEAGPQQAQRVLQKIPEEVIKNAVGLAIFTTMRTGLWISGAGGSGVLVARKEDGTWSPPSGIMLHTAGLGFLVGVDIYDCVLVINTRSALESFTKVRATIGGEVSAVAGPVGVGGVLENDGKWKEANRPVYTYLKSRGFYAGVQVDGTVVIERTDENARFYMQDVGVMDILNGNVRHVPPELNMLMETLRAAEGQTDVDASMLEQLSGVPVPGDFDVLPPGEDKIFGIPDLDDPDPYGVLALQQEGLEIREAGTHSQAPSSVFEYHPKPSSPAYDKYYRKSLDLQPAARRSLDAAPSNHRKALDTTNNNYRRSLDAPVRSSSPLSAFGFGTRWGPGSSASAGTSPVSNYTYQSSDAATQTSNPPTPTFSHGGSSSSNTSRIFYNGVEEGKTSPYSDIFDLERTGTMSSYYGNSSRLTSEYSSPQSRVTQSRQVSGYFKPNVGGGGGVVISVLRRTSSDYGPATSLSPDFVAEQKEQDNEDAVRAKLEALNLPKGPPPPLPPRAAPVSQDSFEDVNLR